MIMTVPEGICEGEAFNVDASGQEFVVVCPMGCCSGQE
jgi:hypothetical protein